MPNWISVLKEIDSIPKGVGPLDLTRRKYLEELHQYTKRNIIAYYSGFVQHPGACLQGSIFDGDINALMNVVHGMKAAEGLDLILHTPGGQVTVTETIVNYLRSFFGNDIRCFVPQLAMSGGTMIACACKEIVMGKQSSIGPIDPQFGPLPAYGVIEDYERAVAEIAAKPSSVPIWQVIFSKISPSLISECYHAIELSSELATKWLRTCMFAGDKKAKEKAAAVVKKLNDHSGTKTHSRHINFDRAIEIGLKIIRLEDDNKLQDLVLTVHHAYMETFNRLAVCKIVEDHRGVATFINLSPQKQ